MSMVGALFPRGEEEILSKEAPLHETLNQTAVYTELRIIYCSKCVPGPLGY